MRSTAGRRRKEKKGGEGAEQAPANAASVSTSKNPSAPVVTMWLGSTLCIAERRAGTRSRWCCEHRKASRLDGGASRLGPCLEVCRHLAVPGVDCLGAAILAARLVEQVPAASGEQHAARVERAVSGAILSCCCQESRLLLVSGSPALPEDVCVVFVQDSSDGVAAVYERSDVILYLQPTTQRDFSVLWRLLAFRCIELVGVQHTSLLM
jgi:hypothetical protein